MEKEDICHCLSRPDSEVITGIQMYRSNFATSVKISAVPSWQARSRGNQASVTAVVTLQSRLQVRGQKC